MIYGIVVRQIPETGCYIGTCRDVQQATASGETIEEVLTKMKESVLLALAGKMDRRLKLLPPTPLLADEYQLVLPFRVDVKIELYRAMLRRQTNVISISRALELKIGQVERIFNLWHWTRLSDIEKVMGHLDVEASLMFAPVPVCVKNKALESAE